MPAPAGPLPQALVVDDHAIARLGVRHLLASRLAVAEAADVAGALDWLAQHDCTLIVLDLSLGDDFGLAALPRLREAAPRARVLVLSSLSEELYADRVLQAGADGYLMKSAVGDALLDAVDTVLDGRVYASPAVRETLLRRVTRGPVGGAVRPVLSPRELEVLRLVAAGRSTREIAETLNRSVKTVETHKQALKIKLAADTPAQLLRQAMAWFEERP